MKVSDLGPLIEGAGKTVGFDWGSVISYGGTLPPSLPKGKDTSLIEGGKTSKIHLIILHHLTMPNRGCGKPLQEKQAQCP